MLFHLQTSYLVPRYNPRSKVEVKFSQKWVKNQRTGPISEAISPTDFILNTKIQPNKAHLMTQVPMTLTIGQGHMLRSNVQKMAKLYKMGHISDAIASTDFILGTKVR